MNQHVIDYLEAMQCYMEHLKRPMAEWYYFVLWVDEMDAQQPHQPPPQQTAPGNAGASWSGFDGCAL